MSFDERIHRRADKDLACFTNSHHRRGIKHEKSLAIGFTCEFRYVLKIDLVAAKIHQFCIHNGKSRLARSLRDNARDQITCENGLQMIVLPHHLEHGEVPGIADLCNDVIFFLMPLRVVGNCQHSLYDLGVGVFAFRR